MIKSIFGITAVLLLCTTVNSDKSFVPVVLPYTWGDNTVQMYAADNPLTNQIENEFAELAAGNHTEEDKTLITIATLMASKNIMLLEYILSNLPQSIEDNLKSIVHDVIANHQAQIEKCKQKLTVPKIKQLAQCALDEAPEIIKIVTEQIQGLHKKDQLMATTMAKFRQCMQIDEDATNAHLHNPNHREPSRLASICRGTLEWSKRNGCILSVSGDIMLDITTFIWHITLQTLDAYSSIDMNNVRYKISLCTKTKIDQWLAKSCKGHVPVLDRR